MHRRWPEKPTPSTQALALLVGWTASGFEKFVGLCDGDLDGWWSQGTPRQFLDNAECLTRRHREQLLELHKQGREAVVQRVASWPGEVICWGEESFPRQLCDLKSPPSALHIRGDRQVLGRPGLAVVGSRKIGPVAAAAARRILEPVTRRGMVVISGGALGADAVAHRCAVDCGGKTVVVLPAGLQQLSPRTNRKLFVRIADGGGLLVSEYAPDQKVRRYHFERRNRLIAALGCGVLILRAGLKSGTMLTVRAARRLDRPMGAMPGQPGDPLSEGCHQLLRDGATLVATHSDLQRWWEELNPGAGVRADDAAADEVQTPELPDCDVLEMALQLRDCQGTFSTESLARATGQSAAQLQTILLKHELSGIVERAAGADRYRIVVSPR